MNEPTADQAPPATSATPRAAIEALRSQYPPILTTADVAELMGSSVYAIRQRAKTGDLPALKWGKEYRYLRDEILAVLESAHN